MLRRSGPILNRINNQPITSLHSAFAQCYNLKIAPLIPETVNSLDCIYESCVSLESFESGFEIPKAIWSLRQAFMGCEALKKLPNTFEIPSGVRDLYNCFCYCEQLTGEITINASQIETNNYEGCFSYTEQPIVITGSSTILEELAATATNGNVTVK